MAQHPPSFESKNQQQKAHHAVNAGTSQEDNDQLSRDEISQGAARRAHAGEPGRWNPPWWTDGHNKDWDTASAALLRDWRQSRSVFARPNADERAQTARRNNSEQAVETPSGDDSLAKGNEGRGVGPTPNPRINELEGELGDEHTELGLRYGYGARGEYGQEHGQNWDAMIEARLRREWERDDFNPDWDRVRDAIRYGYQRARWEH